MRRAGGRTNPRVRELASCRREGAIARLAQTVCAFLLLATLGALVARADVGPPVKVRLLGEPRAAQSGSAFAGQLVIESGAPAVLSGFRFAPSVGLRNATTAPPRVVRLAVPSSVRVAPETPLRIDFEIVAEPSAPVTFAFEFDGETVAKRLDLSAQHVELMTHGGAVVSVAPFDRFAPQAVPGPSAVLRSVRVYGRLVYSRPARCIDTDFDYQVDSCADNLQACGADSGCRSDRIGADNVYVEVKDDRALQADDVLAITQTDEQGTFDVSFSEGGTPDIYLRFEAKNGAVEVEDATWERNYRWRTWTSNNFGGTALNFGTVEPTDNAGALNIHNTVTRVARWSAERIGTWAPKVDVQWPSSDSYYNWLFDEIHIHHAQTQWDDETVAHEWGHRWSESFGKPYHSVDYCNGVCDDPLGGVDEFLLGCGHCRWCNEGGLWAWYEGWSAWVADSFLRSYKSRYAVRPLFAPRTGDDLESPPTASDTSNCVEADLTPCECDPGRAEGFVAALLRDIEDENRTFAFGGAITLAGSQVVYDRQLKPKRAVSAAVDRIAAVGAVEGTLDPVVSIMQCNTSTACSVVATDNDSGGDEPPGPGRNALVARYLTPDWSPPPSTLLFRVRVQGNANTIGPFAARLEDLDDHDGDGIADELAVGATLILQIVKQYKPERPQEFLNAFAAMNPGLLEPLWATAWNVGYDIGDDYPPDPPSQLASTSHTVGGRTALSQITFTWMRAADDVSGVDGYDVEIARDAPAPPGQTLDVGKVTTWTTGPLQAGIYYFTIRSHDRSGKWSSTYASIGPFEIIPSCSFTVVAPNGGELWRMNATYGVSWTCHRDTGRYGPEAVQLDLYKGTVLVRGIGESLGSSISWTVPIDVAPGADYRIRVTSKSNPIDTDQSDADFSIEGDLVDNGDGTVSDRNGCRMWTQNTGLAGSTLDWAAATGWARDLVFAGHSDWRLPSGAYADGSVCNSRPAGANCSGTELATLYFLRLIRFGHSTPFVMTAPYYWTATPWPSDRTRAMGQDMEDGGQNDTVKTSHLGAWAVRNLAGCTPLAGFPPLRVDGDGDGFTTLDDCNDANAAISPLAAEVCGNGIDDNCNGLTDEYCNCGAGLVDHGDGTVTESSTCLMWVKDFAPGNGWGWTMSMDWVANLVYALHDDWRLPTTQIPDATCDGPATGSGYHCSGSEMGHLFYVTLGNQAGQAPGCTGPFLHYGQSWNGRHWSATTDPSNGSFAYVFHFAGTYPGQQQSWYKIQDQYGSYGASILPVRLDLECWGDVDGDGYRRGTDCDDADPTVHPGADEVCDGKDNDCDGAIDEGFTLGLACTSGSGACESAGQTVCATGGRGTGLVRDILPGSEGSSPDGLAVAGQTLFFKAYDLATGDELWKSDGQAAGTVLVKDIYPGTAGSSPSSLTPVGSTVFFVAADATTGGELWKSDGTAAGTVLVKDIRPGTAGSWPSNLRPIGSTLFFVAVDGTSGSELWKSDGTAGGTTRVKDIYPGAPSASPDHLTAMNGILYFGANDGLHGNELWRSDGTDAGTYMVKDIAPGGLEPDSPVVLNGVLYFSAYELATGYELWRSDGTAAGTWLVRDAVPGSGGSNPYQLAATQSLVFYVASDGVNGQELWRSDGTAGGTFMVREINPGPDGCMGVGLTPVGSRVMLLANNGQTGRELWVSDGTPAGTALVRDVLPGPWGNDPYCMLGVGETLFFCAEDGVHGIELWTSDGTYGGTALVRDINPEGNSYPRSLVAFRGGVYFAANDGTNGTELWSSDGTADGTRCGATPWAPSAEVCDGEDNDCDGTADEEALGAPLWHPDADGDTYGAPAVTTGACTAPPGWVADGTDCDDTLAGAHPGLPEIGCDGLDNDCNPATPDVFDADGDGLVCGVDCDDTSSSCTTECADLDGDGVADCAELIGDTDNDGVFPPEDCNDADPFVFPGATESCNGKDDDCDGALDEGCDAICDSPEKLGSDVRVTNAASDSYSPSLVWTGSEYGVSWRDGRDGNSEIYFARFAASGAKIGSDVRVTNNTAASLYLSLVWTGSEYGVSWYDSRDGNEEIYFARLDASGTKIGSDVRVTNNTAYSTFSSLVWTGSEYGVSWEDNRDGNFEIYFARLDASGTKIGSDVRVTTDIASSQSPSLVWTGSGYGVSWHDDRDGNYQIYFARLDASGIKIGSDVRVTNNAATSAQTSLVWTGSEYGVSWSDYRDGNYQIYFARLDASGIKVGSDVRVTTDIASSQSPSLVWTGSEYGVSWSDYRGNYEIYLARVDASGTKIGSDVRVTNDTANSREVSLVWTGSGYGVSWWDDRDGNSEIYFGRVRCCDDADADGYSECAGDTNDRDPAIHPGAAEICDGKDNDSDGALDEGCDGICDSPEKLGSDVRLTNDTASSYDPSLVWTGSEYGVSWFDDRDGNNEIYFARFTASGTKIGSDLRVTNAASDSSNSSLVWTGSEYGVSWFDERDGNYEIYFARLDASGTKIGSDVRVTNAASDSMQASLVWTGSEYGVSWEDNRDGNWEIYFARLDGSGNKIGSDIRMTNAASDSWDSSLVWTGSEYGVSWTDYRDGNSEVYFARLDALGTKIGSDVRVTSNTSASRSSSLVWTGTAYGVSWNDDRDGNSEIYFARLDGSGTKIGSDVRVTNAASDSWDSSLVWTGSEYGVSWTDDRDGNSGIYFARVDASGTKIGADVRVTSNTATSWYPSLIWTGSEYGVSWFDERDGNNEIYFVRVGCCEDGDPGEPGCQWRPESSHVDFGPSSSTPAGGYVGDGGGPFDPARGYGWLISAGTSLTSRSRSCGSTPAEQRGFVFSSSVQTWEMEVSSGDYDVTVSVGDCSFAQGPHRVLLEGDVVVSNESTGAGQFITRTRKVRVGDGRLTVQIGGGGGNTMLSYLDVVPSATQPAKVLSMNFQAVGAPTPRSFVADSGGAYDAAKGRGWSRSLTGNARTRNKAGDKSLDGFVYVGSPSALYEIVLPNGPYDVELAVGDASNAQGPQKVLVEGLIAVNNESTTANQFLKRKKRVLVVDGKLTLEVGGATGNTALNFVSVMTPRSSELHVNFQPAASAIPSGYQADTGAAYTTGRGFGWSVSLTGNTRERNLNADQRKDTLLYVGAPVRTWDATIPNGDYEITVVVGDPSFAQGPHWVTVEGFGALKGETTAANVFLERTVRVPVRDGKLTLAVGGGATGSTTIDYVEVVSVSELASINFQPAASAIPAGYQPDSGRIYLASRGYGWEDDSLYTGGKTRDRNVASDQALDTFIFTSTPAKSWRFDVPNGEYQIAVSVGDAGFSQGPQRIVLEGQTAIDGLTTSAGTFKTATKCVQVADGTATVTIGGLSGNTALDWVKIIGAACAAVP